MDFDGSLLKAQKQLLSRSSLLIASRISELIQMQNDFGDGARGRWRGGGKSGFVVRVAAAVKNCEESGEDKHGRNGENQNAVTQSGDAALAGGGSVAIAKGTTLGESGMGRNHRSGERRGHC
jgi:hypothetical protein